jgi:phosphatidate cytidylyltransferase
VTLPDHSGRTGANASGANDLMLRAASAAVLAPAVLAITYAGGWAFLALCVIAAGRILWEWTALVAVRADPRIIVPGLSGLAIAGALIGVGLANAAAGVLVIEALFAGLASAALPRDGDSVSPIGWAAGGVLYAGTVLFGPALLRADPQWGLTALLFLYAIVWITDIFAYFCGRAFGGPLLWPTVSPHKTWSGAIGGLVGGVAAGVAVAYASGIGKLGIVAVMAFLLSVLAQAGDLFESAIKRHFGVKDTSDLIPGHGGLMDRIDGFMVAAFAALLIGILHQGTAAPARGLLLW